MSAKNRRRNELKRARIARREQRERCIRDLGHIINFLCVVKLAMIYSGTGWAGGWVAYDGDYEKQEYNILTRDGHLYYRCWPNAGKFHVTFDRPYQVLGIQIDEKDVTHICPCDDYEREIDPTTAANQDALEPLWTIQ